MTTLNLAHRGASAYAPENTLAAFDLAFQMGAHGVELDTTLSRDGVPVVIHDDLVDRTTNGHGPVGGMTLEQIKQLDAGGWRDSRYGGERIPTLSEALDVVGTRGLTNIEIKSKAARSDGLEAAVARVIQKTCSEDRVLVSSFNPLALYRMSVLLPRVPRGLLYEEKLPIYLRRAWLRPLARPSALHPKYTMISPALVNWARKQGYAINTWTVDEPEAMRRLIRLGIQSIMTNKPDILRDVLAEDTWR